MSKVAFCLLLLFTLLPVHAETLVKQIADGVSLSQSSSLNVLTVQNATSLKAGLGQGHVYGADKIKGRAAVSAIAKSYGAVAAVNGGYFWQSGDPLGLHITEGELVSEPWPNRAAIGITRDGRAIFDQLDFTADLRLADGRTHSIAGINRPRGKNELVAYTSKYFTETCNDSGVEVVVRCTSPIAVNKEITGTIVEMRAGHTPISSDTVVLSGVGSTADFLSSSLKPGDKISMQFTLKPLSTSGWETVVEAVGGGPWLVRNGQVHVDAIAEGFKPDVYASSTCRTAVGAKRDGSIVIASVGGWRRAGGATLDEMAKTMLSLGCVNAINLDGGGSTTMADSIGVINSPADGTERLVANALLVTGQKPQTTDTFTITGPTEPLCSGDVVRFAVDSAVADRAVWSVSGGIGFIDQNGTFTAIKARSGHINVQVGTASASLPISVTAGKASDLSAKLVADAPNRSTVNIAVTDKNDNPIAGVVAELKVTGGVADAPSVSTDASGKASTGITWDETTKSASVRVLSSGFSARVLARSK